MKKKHPTSIRMSEETKDKLQAIAEKLDVNQTTALDWVIRQYWEVSIRDEAAERRGLAQAQQGQEAGK